MESLLGQVIGKYKLVEHLGSSREGEVYRGLQVGLDREVAVRVLRGKLAGDSLTMARFRQESRATAQLSHPHILTVYDSGKLQGLRYYVMEVAPETLAARLQAGPLAPVQAVKIAEEVARALEYVHERQVFHRLLVPANVRFDSRGSTVVAGFGAEVADVFPRLEAASALGYASPEIMLGEKPGAASDLYQVGVLLYEMCCGRLPYAGRPPFVVGGTDYEDAITPPRKLREEVSRDLEAVTLQCLRADPAERPPDATSLRKELTKVGRKYEVRSVTRRGSGEVKVPGTGSRAGASAGAPTRALQAPSPQELAPRTLAENPAVVQAVTLLTGGHGDLRRPETRIRLAAVALPFLLLVGLGGLWLSGMLSAPALRVVESFARTEARRATISWKVDRACYGFVEFESPSGVRQRTRPTASKQTVFQQTLEDLEPGTTYTYQIAASHHPDGASAQLDVPRKLTTGEALTLDEVRVGAVTATSAVIEWRTNRPATTRLRYWRGAASAVELDDDSQRAETRHRLEIAGLEPGVTYQVQALSEDAENPAEAVEAEPVHLTTRRATGRPDREEVRRVVARVQAYSPAELAKLEGQLADLLGADLDLDTEQKVLLALTRTDSLAGFERRRALAARWARALRRNGAELTPPEWSAATSMEGTLERLAKVAEGPGRQLTFRRLDQCLSALARAEGLPLD